MFYRSCPSYRLLSALLTLFGVVLSCANLLAQEVAPHHLVGHEESALLLRIQALIDDWDPRKLENPLVATSHAIGPDGKMIVKKQLRREDLAEFIADVDAAEALGKAFFWEMQAGSDFEVKTIDQSSIAKGTACASCHYRHGADARNRHTWRVPYVAWDRYPRHPKHPLEFGDVPQAFPVETLATETIPFLKHQPAGPFWLIVGSQGVSPKVFQGFEDQGGWKREKSINRATTGFEYSPEWSMFKDLRQITARNSPSVINAGFSDRLFHDGRAESTFNGFSIFGDSDPREVLHRRKVIIEPGDDGTMQQHIQIVPVNVALTKAALASQAVGPIVNDVEMSYVGRQFPNVAYKLLGAKVLGYQDVSPTDSVFQRFPGIGKGVAKGITYGELIKQAFRSEWWDDSGAENETPLILLQDCPQDGEPKGSLMEGNFSLYWGLSIMLYEASLVSNQSPFDGMMRGRPEMVEAKWETVNAEVGNPIHRDQAAAAPVPPKHESGSAVFQHGFRVFMNRGCVDCHEGPLFSELYERQPEEQKLPIQYILERALLPNSRSDSLAVNLRVSKEALLKQLASIIARIPEAKPRSGKIAIELEELRHASFGRKAMLEARVRSYLNGNFSTHEDVVNEVTEKLFSFEKSLVSRLGNRTYFTEDERIAMAEALGGPVLIEKMRIPLDLVMFRPTLPISGPLANESYAFYDASFYTLGVSPPRYDRGVGGRNELEMSPSDRAFLAAVEKVNVDATTASADDSAQQLRAVAITAYKAYQLTGDSQSALESVSKDVRVSKEALGLFQKTVRDLRTESVGVQSTGAAGNAYKMKRAWGTDRFKSKGYSSKNGDSADAASVARTSADGAKCDLDEGNHKANLDMSWDRNDIPYGTVDPQTGDNPLGPARRSSYYFLSRARRMVYDEEHWGHRKPFLHDNELAFWGSFKTPSLRNVELTAPYMHNGRLMTLRDVVEFYDEEERQVPRSLTSNPDKHPAIRDLDLKDDDKRALIFFLLCLTDDRVRYEQGPFDHPSLTLVNGYKRASDNTLTEEVISISATGEEGHVTQPTEKFPSEK